MRPPVAPSVKPADPLGLVLGRYLLTGDEGAIEEVVAKTRPRLLAAARRIAGREDAEDAIQTAYLSLVRRRGAPLDAPVLPWLMTAVVRNAYRRRAAARRDLALADRLAMTPEDVPPTAVGARADDLAALRGAVARLPARYRDPVVLHDLHGLSTAEVARLLDLSEAGVRTRLHRARLLVRARLAPRLVASILVLPLILVERARDVGLAAALGVGGLMNIPTVVVIAVVALAAGVILGPKVLRTESADEERSDRLEKAEARARALADEVKTVTQERDDALQKVKASLAAAPRTSARAAPPPGEAPAPGPASAKPDASRRIVVPGYEELVEAVDWGKVGTSLRDMVPLVAELSEQWPKTKVLPRETATKAAVLNAGSLVPAALAAAAKLKYEVQQANSAYTHPSFMVNAIAAALEAAGKPLDKDQAEAMTRIGTRFSEEEARRRTSYDDRAFELKKLLDESELKERFFAEAFAALRPDQRESLVAPAAKGRMRLDLYTSGLIWIQRAEIVPVSDAAEATTKIEDGMLEVMGWDDSRRAAVHGPAADLVASLPRETFEEPADFLSLQGMVPVTLVIDWARRELALLDRVGSAASLDDAGWKAIRQVSRILVPIKKNPVPIKK